MTGGDDTTLSPSDFDSDSEPQPISYDTFQRIPASRETSAVAGHFNEKPSSPPPEPERSVESRAAKALAAEERARELERREAEIEQREAQLDPRVREQLAFRELTRDARQLIDEGTFPLCQAFNQADAIVDYQVRCWQASGRIPSQYEVAQALEEHLGQLHQRASSAVRGRRPVREDREPGPRGDLHDLRPIDESERYRRACAVFDSVASRRRSG